jgi:hypothetical protein
MHFLFSEALAQVLAVVSLSILLTWLVCSVILSGIGALILRQFSREYLLTDAFWMGMGTTVAVLEFYHFFRPVDLFAIAFLLALAFVGIFSNRISLLHELQVIKSVGLWPIICYLAVVVSIALRAAGPCEHYDTGLYGAAAVRWSVTYPVVPGLANLHGRLGFNSTVFLCIGALDQGIWHNLAHHLFTGLLISALCASIVPAFFRLFGGKSFSAGDWFLSILLIPAGFWTTRAEVVGMATDVPATAVCFVAAAILFREFDDETIARDRGRNGNVRIVVAMTLFALAITFKLSTVVFASLGWAIAFLKLWSSTAFSQKRKLLIVASILLSVATLLPSIVRSLVLSGYPFYPNTAFAIPVAWRVPVNTADMYAAGVRSWARIPHARLADTLGFRWIGPWFRRVSGEREGFLIPSLLAIGGGLALIFRWIRERSSPTTPSVRFLVPSIGGLLFWFFVAPATRFGEAAMWTAAGTLGTLGILFLIHGKGLRWTRIVLFGLLGTTAWCTYPRTLWRLSYRPLFTIHEFLPLPRTSLVSHQTLSGVTVYVPAEGDQCWDAALLCTPYFDGTFRLRRPENMRWGFESEGPPLPLLSSGR